MPDPRIEQYAEILLDTCLGVQPGWQVMIAGGVKGRPLLEELARGLGRRGAYALQRPRFSGTYFSYEWAREAPIELLEHPSPIEMDVLARIDALIIVSAPENTRDTLEPERAMAMMAGLEPAVRRQLEHTMPWVGGQFPTDALAQDAGLSTAEFADFLYAAVLRDWDADRERMRR